jgi:hypothetical protein
MSPHVLQEAAALLYLRTGMTCCDDPPNLDVVEKLVRDDRERLSPCGECQGCDRSFECMHVAINRAAMEGKTGAIWCAEGASLVGKTFEIIHRGNPRLGVVTEFNNHTMQHEVEWLEVDSVKVRRSRNGARQVEYRSWIDFAKDPVVRCVESCHSP